MSLDAPTGKKQKKGLFGGILGGGKTYFLLAIVAAIIAAGSVMVLLSGSTARDYYYVLTQDVPERTQVTPELLVPVEVDIDAIPANAITLADAQTGKLFTKTALQGGDPVTFSVVGPLERISINLPDDFVVASFTAEADKAVAGKVRTGDLIDVFTAPEGEEGISKLFLYRVLVLDVASSPKTIADAANSGTEGENLNPGPESNAIRGGIPQMYTVGVRPEDAAKLAAMSSNNLYVVLSAKKASPTIDVSTSVAEVVAPGPVADSSAGVTFTEDMGAVQNGQATAGTSEGPAEVPAPVVPVTPPSPAGSASADPAATGEPVEGEVPVESSAPTTAPAE